ncbi:MAG: hypothetical protein ACAI43_18870 [Phycisphaerae bacterium]|nr:hypothetical protein [Tepidisphaeraceae bacterium]
MQTVRQIERYWTARQYDRLTRELLKARPEASERLALELGQALPSAALAIIRLDELCQAHHPLVGKLIRTIIAAQENDGGWGDPLVSALCLRALLTNHGQGVAIERGVEYLATLQQAGGIWPSVSIRRTAEDPFVSAFILFNLADQPAFRDAVRLDDATAWFDKHWADCDPATRKLWDRAGIRCRIARLSTAVAN